MFAKILPGKSIQCPLYQKNSSQGFNVQQGFRILRKPAMTKSVPGAALRLVALNLTGWQVSGDRCQREAKRKGSKQAVSEWHQTLPSDRKSDDTKRGQASQNKKVMTNGTKLCKAGHSLGLPNLAT
jgi:hypothetical protein